MRNTFRLPITTLVGTGNDFVLVDTIRHRLNGFAAQWPDVARRLCAEGQGMGTDGLLVLGRSTSADVRMRIFNPDGSEPSMCGNGIRCLAWYAHRSGAATSSMTIETNAGLKRAQIQGARRVRVDMGTPRVLASPLKLLAKGLRHADWIDSGVPHVVCWVSSVSRVDVDGLGRRLRNHKRFQPQGANVDFVQERSRRTTYNASLGAPVHQIALTMRTYERGVEAETQACGTGSVAAAVSAVLSDPVWRRPVEPDPYFVGQETNLERFLADVRVPGGTLRVELGAKRRLQDGRLMFSHAFLEGEARQVSSGSFRIHFAKRK